MKKIKDAHKAPWREATQSIFDGHSVPCREISVDGHFRQCLRRECLQFDMRHDDGTKGGGGVMARHELNHSYRSARFNARKEPNMGSQMKIGIRIKLLSALVLAALSLTGRVAHASGATIIQYSYDGGDHIATVTDPRGLVTTYVHDGLGQLWQQVSPDTGTTSFAYDGYGRKSSMTRADLTQTTYGYDGLNRPTNVSAGGLTQSFAYDTCTNGLGRLCSDSDATGATSYTYTPEGWVAGRGFSMGGTTYALGYGYDLEGRIASVIYPDNNQANYAYTNGVVSSVSLKVGGVVVTGATAITYQPMNMGMASWTSSNGLSNSMSYDTDGRLTAISVPNVQSLGFTYDNANRITQIGNGIDNNLTQYFSYDAMSRLQLVYSDDDNELFLYDANGNRNVHNVTSETISATSNQLVSDGTNQYGYDAKGNTTTVSGVARYSYDAFNRMVGASGASYYVNPEGQRLSKQVSGVSTYFAPDSGNHMLAESVSGGWSDYVWLNGRLIGRMAGGQVYAIDDDQVGRPEEVTNASQTVVWRAQNFAFTQNVIVSNVALNLGFPGQYYDAETSAWNNGFRDYKSGLGRYVESDPNGLAGGVNTYAYAGNNPANLIDPLGLVCKPSKLVILPNQTNMGSYSLFYYQLEDEDGNPLTGSGYSLQEIMSPAVGDNTNNQFIPMRSGMAQDAVGWANGAPDNADLISDQTFVVQHQSQYYPLTTEFQHESRSVNGVATNTVTVVKP